MDAVGMRSEGKLEKQMQKIAEEVVEASMEVATDRALEFADCHTNPACDSTAKEFGDILFSTIVGCYMAGLNPETCLEMVCKKNEGRIGEGRMINGSFVKNADITGERI